MVRRRAAPSRTMWPRCCGSRAFILRDAADAAPQDEVWAALTLRLFPDFQSWLLHHEPVNLLPRRGADDLFVEQYRGSLQFRQHHRGIERRVKPSLCVALVGALGDAPAQIENAA